MQRCILYLGIVLAGCLGARADLLVLDNGDVLSGSALRVVESNLVFRTSLKGQMMAPMDTIRSLSTEDNFAFGLATGETLYGKLTVSDGEVLLEPIDDTAPTPVNLTDFVEAEKIPQVAKSPSDPPDMAVSVGMGVRGRAGESDNVAPYAQLELNREGTGRSAEASILVEGVDEGFFPAYLAAEAAWRFRTDNDLQPYLAASVERDTDNALDLRTDLTLGLGRVLMRNGQGSLSGSVGINAAYEDWDRDGLERRGGAAGRGDDTETRSELNLRLGLRYGRTLFGTGAIENELSFYPAISDIGDIRAANLTELSYPLTDRLRLRLNLRVDYDNSPGFNDLEEWRGAVGAGVSVDF